MGVNQLVYWLQNENQVGIFIAATLTLWLFVVTVDFLQGAKTPARNNTFFQLSRELYLSIEKQVTFQLKKLQKTAYDFAIQSFAANLDEILKKAL